MKAIPLFFRLFILVTACPVAAQNQAAIPEDITITRDGIRLKGKLFLAGGTAISPTVLLLHGFPGGESDVLGIGAALSKSGINALTFNYSGTYQSEGEISWDNMQSDIHAAFKFLRQTGNATHYKIDTGKIYLGGWCNGGGMALTYSAYHPEVRVVFSIAPSDQTEFMKIYTGIPEIRKMIDKSFGDLTYPKGHLRFAPGATPEEVAEAGTDKINPIYNLKKCASLLASRDLLLIGGWDDEQTTMEVFILPLYRALQKEGAKSIRLIAFQDDHYFQKTRSELAQEVINWLILIANKE